MRFWGRVDRSGGPDACWPWQGSVFKTTKRRFAYGRAAAAGPLAYAHRCAWTYTHGEIPADKILRHSCDNPRCCNPKHLVLGTLADNMHDMWNRGRGGKKKALLPDQVRAIRNAPPEVSNKELAEQYGIWDNIASAVRRRKKYAWVPD